MRRSLVATAAAAVFLGALGATSALAGTVSVSGQTLTYDAAPGEANGLTVVMAVNRTSWTVTETGAPLVVGAGCSPGSDPNTATCDVPDPNAAASVEVALGDADDEGTFDYACVAQSGMPCSATVRAGFGSDTVTARFTDGATTIYGGAGNDDLTGDDLVFGGRGADRLDGYFEVGDGGRGPDTIEGGDWQCDYLQDCNVAYASYASRAARVFVSLDGKRNDGARGERDLVQTAGVIGGSGDDELVGSVGHDFMAGGPGDDFLRGRLLRDNLVGDDFGCTDQTKRGGNDRLYGGGRLDNLWGCGGADRLLGGDGGDELIGGAGRDRLHGGRGHDDMWGNAGNDFFRARDGVPHEDLYGGSGWDRARLHIETDRTHSIERKYG